MKTRTHFAHRVDTWDDDNENVIEHLADVEDFEVAKATYHAACRRWPNASITLRQGARSSRTALPPMTHPTLMSSSKIGLTRQLGYNQYANSVGLREEAMAKTTAKKKEEGKDLHGNRENLRRGG